MADAIARPTNAAGQPMTYREMCEQIAARLNELSPGDAPVDWTAIWEMSPSGEIWPIWELYSLLFPGEVRLVEGSANG